MRRYKSTKLPTVAVDILFARIKRRMSRHRHREFNGRKNQKIRSLSRSSV